VEPPQHGGETNEHTNTYSGPVLQPLMEEGNTAYETTISDSSPPPPRNLPRCRRCNNRAALDCDNQMCSRHCVLHGRYTCQRHNVSR
jgi:hypothetical protein